MTSNYCSQCGTGLGAGVRFCPSCGQNIQTAQPPVAPLSPPQYVTSTQPQYSADPPGKGMAIGSIVLGIVSMFVPYGGILLAIIGIILAINAKSKLSDVGHPTGTATAGIVLNVISLVWFFIFMMALLR